MLTTQESINYQFSLIFGYSSSEDIITGDLIGPGKLTRKKINELSIETIRFLKEFNALVRDYTGSEVFSIEFELYNYDKESARTSIYPKSMFLLPGAYKDCESLLVALKPETGYLDVHKSRRSVDNVCEMFYEVEQFTNRPDLDRDSRKEIFDRFSGRFSQKLFGKLIEDKWNKKLIGVDVSLPTEKDMLNEYSQVKSEVKISWHKSPPEMSFSNSQFKKYDPIFEGKAQAEHLKYLISEPSTDFIAQKVLNLGQELINLANIGTINESQDELVYFIIKLIKMEFEQTNENYSTDELISKFNEVLNQVANSLKKFITDSEEFLISGESGNLDNILKKFRDFIKSKSQLENIKFKELNNLVLGIINNQIITDENVRASDFRVPFNYFSELIRNSINIIRTSLSKYLAYIKFKNLTHHFINELNNSLVKEKKPTKLLGKRFINRFESYLLDKIETNKYVNKNDLDYNRKIIFDEFNKLIKDNLDPFFKNSSLKIQDIISFSRINIETNDKLDNYIEKFKRFPKETNYLLSYILRYSTINRFLKEESEDELRDPVLFANKFHRFLEKRLGGINLFWKAQILEWIKDYSNIFLKLKEQKNWTLKEIYNDFIEYLEDKTINEYQIEEFLDFLDYYIAKIPEEHIKKKLIAFLKQYELSMEIKPEFLNYLRKKINDKLESLQDIERRTQALKYLEENERSYYSFIKEKQLQYFSTLIPRPISLILKHDLSNEEKQLFKGDLFHVIDFKYWHNNVKLDLSDNFKEVYREWLREL